MIAKSIALLAVAATALTSSPAPLSFDMKDPKGVSGLSFSIDSNLEPIFGQSSAIGGSISFDPANPEKSSGKIVVQSAGVETHSENLTSAMHQDWCLDVEKFPTIEFEVKKISNVVKKDDGSFAADVNGDFTFHGVTKNLNIKATATHLPDKLKDRGGVPGKKGDLLIIRSNFSFNRKDFNVAPDLALIGDTVDVKLATVGYTIK
ncbi:MAG: YceI family protein [Fimbriimonadaceae bacterium]